MRGKEEEWNDWRKDKRKEERKEGEGGRIE